MRTILTNVARSTPFDNSTNGFVSLNTQEAIEEAKSLAVSNDRYPFFCSDAGNVGVGKYLNIYPSLTSDTSPFGIPETSKIVRAIFQTTSSATVTAGIFKTTDLVTPILSLSLSASTYFRTALLSVALNQDDKLAVRITAGSCGKPTITVWIQTNL